MVIVSIVPNSSNATTGMPMLAVAATLIVLGRAKVVAAVMVRCVLSLARSATMGLRMPAVAATRTAVRRAQVFQCVGCRRVRNSLIFAPVHRLKLSRKQFAVMVSLRGTRPATTDLRMLVVAAMATVRALVLVGVFAEMALSVPSLVRSATMDLRMPAVAAMPTVMVPVSV